MLRNPNDLWDTLRGVVHVNLIVLCMSNTPLGFNKYVMELKGFLIYPKRGITHALSNFKHKQNPSYS